MFLVCVLRRRTGCIRLSHESLNATLRALCESSIASLSACSCKAIPCAIQVAPSSSVCVYCTQLQHQRILPPSPCGPFRSSSQCEQRRAPPDLGAAVRSLPPWPSLSSAASLWLTTPHEALQHLTPRATASSRIRLVMFRSKSPPQTRPSPDAPRSTCC
jgi:hypothetical protein